MDIPIDPVRVERIRRMEDIFDRYQESRDPELLEQPPDEVFFDQGYEYHEPKPQAAPASARVG